MKLYRYLVAVLFISIMSISTAFSDYYTYTATQTGSLSFIIPIDVVPTIGGQQLETGDEIGLFTMRGGNLSDCFGALVYTTGVANNFQAYGEDTQTPIDGFQAGETIIVHIYDASTATEYTDIEIEWELLGGGNYNGTYNTGLPGVVFTKLNAVAPPRAPETFTPADGTVGIALSGNMTWEDISDYADSYDIQISTDGVNADVADETGLATNSYAYSNLLNGTDYWWRVRGNLTGEGAGDWSAWQQVQTVLAPPSVFSPNDNAFGVPTTGNLVWTSVTGASNYEWEIFDDMAMTNTVASGTTANTNAAYAGLDNNTEYWWQVKATNGANMSDWSTASKFTTEIGAVTLQSPVDASMMIDFPAMLEWVALPGAVSYEIMVAEDAGFTVNVMNFANGDETYSLAGLDSWTEYYWQVRGVDAGDNTGEWSATWSFTTDLLAPMNPDPANGSNGALLAGDLMWDAVNGADEYEVTLATDDQFNNLVAGFPATVAGTTAAYAGLAFDTEYFWQVEAKNANPASAVSATWSFRTRLDSPTLLSPADASDCNMTSLTLDWADFTADYYNLQVATDDQFTNFVGGFDGTAELTAHEQILTGLDNSTTYWWRVQAYKNGQFSGYSPAFEFTTESSVVVPMTPTNFSKGIAVTDVELEWESVAAASMYTVEYADNVDFTGSSTIMTANTTATIAGPLNNNETYFWRVYSDACGADQAAEAIIREFKTMLAAPVLTSPADAATDVALSGTFAWDAVAGANEYEIQVSTTSDFSSDVHIMDGTATNSYDYTNIEHNTVHYWRVRAYDDLLLLEAPAMPIGAPGEWSSTFSFTTVELGPPTLTVPANGYQGTLFDVQIFWNVVPEAVSYNAQASTDPTFTDNGQLLLDVNTALPTATVMGVDYGTTVYWRAQTVTAQETSNWSAAYSFTTIPEPVISGNADVCENSNGMYSVAVNPNINYQIDYQWSVVGGTINGSSTGTSVDVTFDTPGEGEVTVMRSSAQWNEYSDSYTLDITVNPTVDMMTEVDIMSYYEDKYCVNELITFAADEDVLYPVENYEWWVIDGENETLISTNSWVAYQFPASGMFTVELRATSPSYCGVSTVATEIEIDETCPIMIDVPDMSACRLEPATFSSSVWGGDGNYSYYWHPANQLDNANIAEPTILSVLWNQNYTIQVQDGNGMLGTDYSYVTVKSSPVVNTKSFDIIDNDENTINLNDYITSMSDPNATPNWYYMSGGNIVEIVDPTNEPTVQPYGFRKYYVTITDAQGCTSSPAYTNTFKRISKEITEDDIVAGMNGSSIMASYPNPVDTKVNVYAEFAETSDITVKIVDLLGNTTVVDRGFGLNVYEKAIDMSNFTSGVYMIVIDSGNDSIVRRVIKQ